MTSGCSRRVGAAICCYLNVSFVSSREGHSHLLHLQLEKALRRPRMCWAWKGSWVLGRGDWGTASTQGSEVKGTWWGCRLPRCLGYACV